jgi:hypothetical protein
MPTYSANDAQPVAFRKPDKMNGRRLGKPQTQEEWELADGVAAVFGATELLAHEVHLISQKIKTERVEVTPP